MASYLNIDFLNNPFKEELSKKILLSKTLNSSEKKKLQSKIKDPNFINILKTTFNKSVFTSTDINMVIDHFKGDN